MLETNYSEEVKKALAIATEAHKGQKDKGGNDYINHPLTVAKSMETDDEIIVALLHDVVEDTDTTIDDLKEAGFNDNVLNALATITKSDDESYDEYVQRVKKNPIATKVKLADLKHNSDLSRIKNPTEKDYKRVEKYHKYIELLERAAKE